MDNTPTVDIADFLKDDAPPAPVAPDLIYGEPEDVLREVARRREAGASLDAIRRDTAVGDGIPDYVLERAAELGRQVEQYHTDGRYGERRRLYGGVGRLPYATNAERDAALRAFHENHAALNTALATVAQIKAQDTL